MGAKAKVLVCDDEPDFLEVVAAQLQAEGYDVSTVGSGEEAIRRVKESTPDIVFLDIRMPVMDGIQTLRQIRKHSRSLPVVILTANYRDEITFTAADELGSFGFFPKTGSLHELIAVIQANLRSNDRG
ncbi:MAG: response regulator [Candidatus Omnitrophica bacterium]|nr:response regulator [Candidatus Omnitrophota bacterium]